MHFPERVVLGFAYALLFIELIIGLMLILGRKTRFFAAIRAIVIAVLIFVSSVKADWLGVG